MVIDNVANTYFTTQKKLSSKQARWQEFLGEFDFIWLHKPGKHSLVADALSRKEADGYVAAVTAIHTTFLYRVKQQVNTDSAYVQLRQQVRYGLVRKYWVEGDLLYAAGGILYIPVEGGLK